MKVTVSDLKLNEKCEAADPCDLCGGKILYEVTFVDGKNNVGDISWECTQCGAGAEDILGWILARNPITFMGKPFYPIKSRANIGPCLNCGKLVVGVPLILFLDEGRKGELDFCFRCAKDLGILDQLK